MSLTERGTRAQHAPATVATPAAPGRRQSQPISFSLRSVAIIGPARTVPTLCQTAGKARHVLPKLARQALASHGWNAVALGKGAQVSRHTYSFVASGETSSQTKMPVTPKPYSHPPIT